MWSKQGLYPGTGPLEQLTLVLPDTVKVIIFDVMSNQDVVDACGRSYHGTDPLRACRAVVDASHAEWLLNEDCCEESGAASYDDTSA